MVIGHPYLLNLDLLEDVPSPPALTPILCYFNTMYNLTCYSVPFILSRTLQLCRIGSLHLPAIL